METLLTFAALPSEIHDAISVHLDLPDLRNLRITCHEVSNKTTGSHHFQSFYSSKSLLFESDSLKLLIHNVRLGSLGALLEHLTLIGPLRRPSTDEENAELQNLLVTAFRSVLEVSKHHCLRSLTLKVATNAQPSWINREFPRYSPVGVQVDPWKDVWESARWTFLGAMAALNESQLPLEDLDAFFSVTRCSLSCGAILEMLGSMKTVPYLKDLKKLSLSLSRMTRADTCALETSNAAKEDSAAAAPRHHGIHGVTRLLRSCPMLEKLQLHWYNTGDWERPSSERLFFSANATRLLYPNLQDLTLQGIQIQAEALLDFIKRHPITRLTLTEVQLGPCNFVAWFDRFRRRLEYVEFDEISMPWPQRYQGVPGTSMFKGADGRTPGPSRFVRSGSDAKLPIALCDVPIGHVREEDMHDYVANNQLHYGPPR